MAQPSLVTNLFANLFQSPSIERFSTELDWQQFEHFVSYVFERAGYTVEHAGLQYGQGVDLKLYASADKRGRPIAYVSVKHFSTSDKKVTLPQAFEFGGALQSLNGNTGYVVTNRGFTPKAQEEPDRNSRLRLINGETLIRYINYVRGSRDPDAATPFIAPDVLFAAEKLVRRSTEQTRIVALANNKGGVAKTTTTLNLGYGLSQLGKRVLVVDLDGQANLTQSLPYSHGNGAEAPHMGDYFMRRLPLSAIIRPTEFPRLWLLPAHAHLRLADEGPSTWTQTELRFASDLHSAETRPPLFQDIGHFDWILLDTPPSMSLHTRAALGAAHLVIAPVTPSAFADSGLEQLLDTTEAMRGLMGQEIQVLGCAVTRWQELATYRDSLGRLRRDLGNKAIRLFESKIPQDANIERAHFNMGSGGHRTIFSWSRRGAGEAYHQLLQEVILHASNS